MQRVEKALLEGIFRGGGEALRTVPEEVPVLFSSFVSGFILCGPGSSEDLHSDPKEYDSTFNY
jgi:hypothetical protein